MSVKIEEILMKVKVDTSEGVNRLGLLEDAYQKLIKAQKEAKNYTEQRSVADALGIVKEKIDQQREALGLTGLTIKQLRILQREYAQGWQTTFTEGSEGWKEARRNYDIVGERIKAITRNTAELDAQNLALIENLRSVAQQYGLDALAITDLEKLSKHYYDSMIVDAGAGQIENHALYQEYLNINRVMKSTKEKLSAVKVAENAYNEELKQTVKELGIEALSLDRLKDYHNLLQKEIGQTINLEDAHGKSLVDNYQRVGSLIDSKKKQIEGTQPLMNQIFGSIPSAIAGGFGGGLAALGLDSIGSIPAKIANVTRAVGELDDVNSDLEISLGKTDAQVKALNSDLGDIDTRTKVSELKDLAIIAGDLNEADVAGFVEQMDKAQIVFSRDFSNAEELATTFGKLQDLFPESRKMPMVEFIQAYGSAIKKLNDDGPATTKGIIDFTTRLGNLPDAIKPTATEIFGLAALLEEAGMTAERSSGGLSNILLTASQNSGLFAKQLKMSKTEFRELINTNPNEFLIKLAQSFYNASGTKLGERLKELKINSQESISVLGTLSDNVFKLKDKQELANKATQEANRLDEVFNEKNTNKAAVLEKAGKVWTSWMNTLSNGLTSVFMPVISRVADAAKETKSLNEQFKDAQKQTENVNKNLVPLITKFETLASKQNLSATEQRDLNTTIADIAKVYPGAITKTDEYGRAIAINIGLLK
jgi:TP901 family phage tail tape measure protein